jgi:[protein-PII] uridylyltransferase
VQSLERMRMLLVLTVADIKAVGPGVWNGWKGQLLRTLYYETEPLLTGGHSQVSRDRRVAEAKEELATALSDWPAKERNAYLKRHYPAYWLRVDLPHKIAHADLLRRGEGRAPLARDVGRRPTPSRVSPRSRCSRPTTRASCRSSPAPAPRPAATSSTPRSSPRPTARRSIRFRSAASSTTRPTNCAAAGKIGELIEQALSGDRPPAGDRRRARRSRGPPGAFALETSILVDNSWSNQFTVIEASGLDRPGLLYDLTRAISDLNLNIASAHIVTFGERAVDVFYVTDLLGHKIANASREAAIRRRLKAAFDGAPEPARGSRKKEPACASEEPA